MKLDKYTRRKLLKAKGIKTLPASAISKGQHDGKPVHWFDNETALSRYASFYQIAGKGCSAWSHTGWFADKYYHETVKPVIAIIGKATFYGYTNSNEDGIMLIHDGFKEKLEDDRQQQIRDLASYADSESERAAEEQQRHNERWQEAQDIESAIKEKESERASCFEKAREWVTAMRGSIASPSLCAKLRMEISKLRARASTLASEIASNKESLKSYAAVY